MAIAWVCFISVVLFFPPIKPVTAANMNYAGPIMGAVLIFAGVDWVVRGRRNFHGPTAKVMDE